MIRQQQFFDGLTLEGSPLPPSARFWFGTDTNGRDQFSRLLYGAQTSLLIGILANGIAVLIGTVLGVTAGYLRGLVGRRHHALHRSHDGLSAAASRPSRLPPSSSPGLIIVILVIALVNWVQIARVDLYRDGGACPSANISRRRARWAPAPARILLRHLLPHLVPTVIVYATLGIATTVLLEAMLSFLGRGVQPPTPAWGMMIFESQSYFLNAPWLVFIPGAAILILALVLQPRRRRPARCARPDPTGTAADAGLSRQPPRRLASHPARRQHRHLRPHLHDPGRSGGHDRRAQCHARHARADPPSARPRPAAAGAICSAMSARLAQGDFGNSYARKTDVGDLIASRLPPTLLLMLGAIVAELLIGMPGRHLCRQRGAARLGDKVAMTLSFVTVSTPQFVRRADAALCLRLSAGLVSARRLRHLSAISSCPPSRSGMAGGGWYSRMMRSSMIEVLRQDYIRTARAKGMPEWRVILRHGLRNAILPIIAMIGLDVGIFMSGVVVVENVFGWPGIGQLMWQAIQSLDIPIIMGVTTVAAVFIVARQSRWPT